MATALEIVTGALRAIGVIDVGEAANAEDGETGLTGLNDMIASWSMRGIHTGTPVLGENDQFPFEDGHVAGVKALLAVYLADDYGRAVTPNLAARAKQGWQAIQTDFGVKEPLRVDPGLSIMPSMRRALD